MKNLTFILLSLLIPILGISQDTLNVLNYDEFLEIVTKNHPYAYRSNLLTSMGKASVTQSRGAFDPKLFGSMDQKYFDKKQYYSHLNSGLKIPTWFGLSAETGYSQNEGIYLNPEQRLPSSGLWYAGLRLELGNGLIIDQRRAEFEKAKIYETSTDLERTILLNELKRNASIAYWKWQQAYEELNIYELAYTNAYQRLQAIKGSVLFGDRPHIDTTEASITLENWNLQLSAAKTKYMNAELNLEIYLWSDGLTPLEIEQAIPEKQNSNLKKLQTVQLDSLVINHPYMQINELETKEKQIDLQLKREQLKPQLTLKYNALSEPINETPFVNYNSDNYNWGATFSYPILSRKERGSVQLSKLKLQDQQLKNKLSLTEKNYKIIESINNYHLAIDQLKIYNQLAEKSQIMYTAEKSLFEFGESSVFMINSRESSWLKNQIELIKMGAQSKILRNELLFQLMIEDENSIFK